MAIARILIIDNGSQYTHLIKRTCRDLGYETKIINAKQTKEELKSLLTSFVSENLKIILSGGPGSVYSDPPNLSSFLCSEIRDGRLKFPLLGICYGHQMIGHVWGATVAKGKNAEYGTCAITRTGGVNGGRIMNDVPFKFVAWVSHFDEVKELPDGFVSVASSETCAIEAMEHVSLPIFGVQFHPEVWHTENGEKILANFLKL